ncbi:MAG: hypothetical protein V3T82_00395, partial [Nitrospinaceae bacterium]
GLRTKGCRNLGIGIVDRVRPIKIERDALTIEDTCFSMPSNLDFFAECDGFKSWPEMRDFFQETHGLPFTGILIRWELIREELD